MSKIETYLVVEVDSDTDYLNDNPFDSIFETDDITIAQCEAEERNKHLSDDPVHAEIWVITKRLRYDYPKEAEKVWQEV